MNDDHHTSIYLQLNDYNSILEQSMTLYECLRWCTGICNEPRVTCMKAQQKKLSGCASNSLAHEDLGHFEEAHHWNIQAKFYNEKFPLVYESDNI